VALVLVVDDDVRIRHLLQSVLRTHGFQVAEADDGDTALNALRTRSPDAMVLDLKMPRVGGLETLKSLRAAGQDLPVLVLTGMVDEEYVVNAFEAGADDYVVKPFQPRALVARLNRMLQRDARTRLDLDGVVEEEVGEVRLDPRTHQVSVGEHVVALSPTEYQLLRVLMHGAGRMFTAAELLALVWGPAYAGEDDIVRANVYRLRQKMEPTPGEPKYIRGRRGVGYFFAIV
jgi:DNA-binding response OmpR family regulator